MSDCTALTAHDTQSEGISIREEFQQGLRWPPRGWPMFSCITRTTGTSPCTGRNSAPGAFLTYDVQCNNDGTYALEIMSGHMNRGETSFEPAIGIRFSGRADWLDENPQNAVLDMHVCGRSLAHTRSGVLNVILAITYTVSRIDRGAAPDIGNVLKTFHLD